jgi:hypothetical protein
MFICSDLCIELSQYDQMLRIIIVCKDCIGNDYCSVENAPKPKEIAALTNSLRPQNIFIAGKFPSGVHFIRLFLGFINVGRGCNRQSRPSGRLDRSSRTGAFPARWERAALLLLSALWSRSYPVSFSECVVLPEEKLELQPEAHLGGRLSQSRITVRS